ncbi:MAG: AAA family ATPase [Blastocatellia bacterium]|nr:AAA family ATPase [Blastocatellia bacterium]
MIVTVTTRKGGAGKSTVTMQLAGALAARGAAVLVVDGDPQASAVQWAAAADEKPFPVPVVNLAAAGSRIDREILEQAAHFEYTLVDCPPASDSPVSRSALWVSNLALVPVNSSPLDLWGAVGIRDVIEDVQAVNEKLHARVVINQCQENTTLAREVIEALEGFGIPAFTTRIGHRTVYRQSAVFGGTVHDFGNRASQAIS